jgi:hypothetical protein
MSGFQETPSREKQLEAATTVYPFAAAQVLSLDQTWRDSPIESVARCFTFSRGELLDFLRGRPDRVKDVLERSLDNRSTPTPYVEQVGSSFRVGDFGGTRHNERTYREAAEAVADYIFRFWSMKGHA